MTQIQQSHSQLADIALQTFLESLLTEDQETYMGPVAKQKPSQTIPAHWLSCPANLDAPVQQSDEQLNKNGTNPATIPKPKWLKR